MFTHETLTCLALCNNHFSTSRGSDRSPLEMVAGRKLSKPTSSLFGTQVLAEIPDSVRQHSPLSTRNMECTFKHLGLERGPVVQGFIRVDGKAELMRIALADSKQLRQALRRKRPRPRSEPKKVRSESECIPSFYFCQLCISFSVLQFFRQIEVWRRAYPRMLCMSHAIHVSELFYIR